MRSIINAIWKLISLNANATRQTSNKFGLLSLLWQFCSFLFGPRKANKQPNELRRMEFDKDFLGKLFEQAVVNLRLCQNYELRTSSVDTSQRMLNALLPEKQL